MQSPIFLFSLPRSGSTLLQRILMSHRDICSISEPWLLLPFVYAGRESGVVSEYSHCLSRLGVDDFINNLPYKYEDYYKALRIFVNSLYSLQCKNNEKYFLDKTPRYYYIIPEIIKIFPDAKFIFLFRNPVHIASSMIHAWGKGSLKKGYGYDNDLRFGPKALLDGYKLIEHKSYAVNYEEYVSNPNKYMKEIFDYLELNFDPKVLNDFMNQDTKGRLGDFLGLKSYQNISTNSLDKWKTTFNSAFRKKVLTNYIMHIEDDFFNQRQYNKKAILQEIIDLKVSRGDGIKDRFDYYCSCLIKLTKANMFFGNESKAWFRNNTFS